MATRNYYTSVVMGSTGPDIPTDGLNLYYDYGNPACYPGSGTSVFDLSGNGNTGGFSVGVAYSASNGGILDLTSASISIVNVPNATTLQPTTGCTYVVFVNSGFPSVGLEGGMGCLGGGGSRGYLLGSDTTNRLSFYIAPTNTSLLRAQVTFNIKNTWTMVHGRFSASSYIDVGTNGVIRGVNTSSIPASTQQNTLPLQIGARGDNDGQTKGFYGPSLIYNRPLSDAELLQIFEAFRARYSI
jgi:hypothetical protein